MPQVGGEATEGKEGPSQRPECALRPDLASVLGVSLQVMRWHIL